MEAREPEGRALRTGKKEPADSWRRRDPHRTMNLEAFGSIFRFSRENSFIQRNGTFSDTIKFNRGEKLGGTELFPFDRSARLDGERAYGRPASASPEG